jgi:hypothetical protein
MVLNSKLNKVDAAAKVSYLRTGVGLEGKVRQCFLKQQSANL